MPVPLIPDEILESIHTYLGETWEAQSCSDGIAFHLPDGRAIEINNSSVMLRKISSATSAQAVADRLFFEQAKMKEVAVAVKVKTVDIDNAQQVTQWFDATEKLGFLYPESEEHAQKKPKPSEVEMKK